MNDPEPGLCGRCVHARRVTSGKGSVFLRCGRSDTDPSFRRYPVLPMRDCRGFEPGPDESPLDPPAGS